VTLPSRSIRGAAQKLDGLTQNPVSFFLFKKIFFSNQQLQEKKLRRKKKKKKKKTVCGSRFLGVRNTR